MSNEVKKSSVRGLLGGSRPVDSAQSKPEPILPKASVADRRTEPPAATRILVLALPRSGTTILWQILKSSLPDDAVCLFEPASCEPENASAIRDKNVLSKVLIQGGNGGSHYSPQACAFFDKRIFLQRDPRDILVSTLLYSSYHTAITSDFSMFAQFVTRRAGQGARPATHMVLRFARPCVANKTEPASPLSLCH